MNRIKQLREEKEMNQIELGKIVGVSGQAMGMYENEKRGLDTKTASILADFFNVSIDYLTCNSDIRNPQKIKLDDMEIAFASGIKGLNKENQETLKNIMEGLLAKQELEDEDKKENR